MIRGVVAYPQGRGPGSDKSSTSSRTSNAVPRTSDESRTPQPIVIHPPPGPGSDKNSTASDKASTARRPAPAGTGWLNGDEDNSKTKSVAAVPTATKKLGKRKLADKVEKATLDKLADLDLDSTDEELDGDVLALTVDDDDDFFNEAKMGLGHGLGHGRGRGRPVRAVLDRFPEFAKQRIRTEESKEEKEALRERQRTLSEMFADDDEVELAAGGGQVTGSKMVTEDADARTEAAAKTGDEAGAEAMCQMKWLRTVGLDEQGKIVCTVGNKAVTKGVSANSSVAGKTESFTADTIRNLITIYEERQAEVVDKDGIVATPLHAVKTLAMEHGETLHCEATCFGNGYNRVELFSGSMRGMGEGMTKRIAAQMASIDLLERIQLSGGAVKVPTVGFLPGWLTSNDVFGDLIALAKSKGMPKVRFVITRNVDDEGRVNPKLPPFRAECWIGQDLVEVAESEAEIFAKRESARKMYQTISNAEYRDTPYAIGQTCRTAAQLGTAGYKPVMSDYKKLWLLQHRVENKQLMVPEEEAGFDDPIDVEELEKDIGSLAEAVSYKLMKSKTIKVTVRNKKKRMAVDDDEGFAGCFGSDNRAVSVESKDLNLGTAAADDDWC